jgi:hypothetical protein
MSNTKLATGNATLTDRQRLLIAAGRAEPPRPAFAPAPRRGAPAVAAERSAGIAEGIKLGYARARYRQAANANPQVTAFSLLQGSNDHRELRKTADLLEHAGAHPRQRHVLTDPAERGKKLAIETGWDAIRDQPRKAPLEPWTGPPRSVLLYAHLMRDPDGAHSLGEYGTPGLDALAWMADEELISVGEHGEIHALSDGRPKDGRRYPGAPVGDALAKAGRSLMGNARGLILAALYNLSSGRTVRRTRKRRRHAAETADGMQLTAAQVCAEANRIKARRPDLAGFRYLSLSRCRELIRDLIDGGVIEQVEPPRAVRQRRSWRTIPRVIARITAEVAERLGLRPPHQEAAI